VIVDNGEVRAEAFGRTLHVQPEFDAAALPDIQKWFEANYTIQFANYPVDQRYLQGDAD
jgi:formylmethanofuran dehydrogenase subunit A